MAPEEKAREQIDTQLKQCGCTIQNSRATGEQAKRGGARQFRLSRQLRIAVTVDMIATGTDITAPRGSAFFTRGAISQSPAESRDTPLEVLLFLRDVRSRVYLEQMKGRGTRVLTRSEMQAVSGEDARTKDHFVIVDAVGICDSDTAQPGNAYSNRGAHPAES